MTEGGGTTTGEGATTTVGRTVAINGELCELPSSLLDLAISPFTGGLPSAAPCSDEGGTGKAALCGALYAARGMCVSSSIAHHCEHFRE